MKYTRDQLAWASLRISLGLIFLWAFFDKLIGLGFTTCRNADTGAIETMCESAWLSGGSPTLGFLNFGTSGPFASLYQAIAGNLVVDWLFMLGLLFIGGALVLGIGIKIAGYSGALLMLMMWSAALLPEHHPFLDDHIIYGIVLIGLTFVKSGHWFGFGERWSKTKIVKQYPLLE